MEAWEITYLLDTNSVVYEQNLSDELPLRPGQTKAQHQGNGNLRLSGRRTELPFSD